MPRATKKTTTKAPSFKKKDKVHFEMDGDLINATIKEADEEKIVVITTKTKDEFTFEPDEFDQIKEGEAPEEEATPAEEEAPAEEEEKKPAKGAKKETRSLAGAWNKAKPKTGGGGFPAGKWEALVLGGEANETDKGISTQIKLVGVNDDEVTGKTTSRMSFLCDAEGNWNEQAVEFFKGDLIKLGIEEDAMEIDESEPVVDELNRIMKPLKKTCPWIRVTVAPQKNNPQYMNVYIDGLMEDQDEKPEIPSF